MSDGARSETQGGRKETASIDWSPMRRTYRRAMRAHAVIFGLGVVLFGMSGLWPFAVVAAWVGGAAWTSSQQSDS